MNTALQYVVMLPDNRYLARLRIGSMTVYNTAYRLGFFAPPYTEAHDYIVKDINKIFSFTNIKVDNTTLFKIAKNGIGPTSYLYILKVNTSVRLIEKCYATLGSPQECMYPVSKQLMKDIVARDLVQSSWPKILTLNNKEIISTIDELHYLQ